MIQNQKSKKSKNIHKKLRLRNLVSGRRPGGSVVFLLGFRFHCR